MIFIVVASWVSVVLVLVAYASHRPIWFDRANVVLCVPVCLPALILGAWSSAAISIAFGAIAAWHLWKPWHERRKLVKKWKAMRGDNFHATVLPYLTAGAWTPNDYRNLAGLRPVPLEHEDEEPWG